MRKGPARPLSDRTATFLRQNARWLSAGALLAFMSSFGQTFFISIFAGAIRTDFGLSHGQWGGIYALGTMASALAMVWTGALTDRFRARALGSVILAALAAACLAMALNPFAALLPLVIFALRLTGQGMSSHIAVVAMSRWFVATRGRALAVATLGFSAGEALLPLLFVLLLTLYDWRLLWVGAALVALMGILPLRAALRTERTPQSMAEENAAVGMDGRHWTRAEVLRGPLFWFMVPALLGPSAFNTAFFFHQVHFAEIKAVTHLGLVALFPLYTAVSILAMVLSGWALDRYGTARLLPLYQLPMVAAFLVFAYGDGTGGALLGFLFLGLTTGANSTLPNAFWAEFFGTQHLGAIKAFAAAVMVLGSALGPGLTGALIDAGLALDAQYVGVAAYFLLASLMMFLGIRAHRHRLPSRLISVA